MLIEFTLNGTPQQVDVEPTMPVLWMLREQLRATGTKFGCGMGLCGACTIHLDDTPVRSCSLPSQAIQGRNLTTIEGIESPNGDLHPVQLAWMECNVPQCGYCQSGQIMSAVALLQQNPNPDDDAIDRAMSGNICRCGTYPRIRQAVKLAADRMGAVQYYPAQGEAAE